MRNHSKSNKNENTHLSAGAAGAGGGTLLVLLANNLPEASHLKSWLLILAPTVTVALTALWLLLKKKLIDYFDRKEFHTTILRAKETLQEALQNPNTSVPHKEQLCKDLEQLERLAVDSQLQRVRTLVDIAANSSSPDGVRP